MVRVDAAREHEDRAEPELEERRQQVADADAAERAAPVAREARVVGDERRPGHGDGDDGVDREPERAVVPARSTRCVRRSRRRGSTRRGRRPTRAPPRSRTCGRSGARSRSGPSSASTAASTAEHELPEPDRLEAEQLVAQQAGRGRDHDQLEDRPAEALEDVQPGRDVRAPPAERRALQHHRRHARVGPDQRRDREHARCRSRRRRASPSSACFSDRSKYAGRTSTSSEMPRFVQSSVVSSVPSTRRRSGTGSIPQLGVSCKGAGSVPACDAHVAVPRCPRSPRGRGLRQLRRRPSRRRSTSRNCSGSGRT